MVRKRKRRGSLLAAHTRTIPPHQGDPFLSDETDAYCIKFRGSCARGVAWHLVPGAWCLVLCAAGSEQRPCSTGVWRGLGGHAGTRDPTENIFWRGGGQRRSRGREAERDVLRWLTFCSPCGATTENTECFAYGRKRNCQPPQPNPPKNAVDYTVLRSRTGSDFQSPSNDIGRRT